MEDTKQHIVDLWKVLRKQCTLQEANKITYEEHKRLFPSQVDTVEFPWDSVRFTAYRALLELGEVDPDKVFNLRTKQYESDKDKQDDYGFKQGKCKSHMFSKERGWLDVYTYYGHTPPDWDEALGIKQSEK